MNAPTQLHTIDDSAQNDHCAQNQAAYMAAFRRLPSAEQDAHLAIAARWLSRILSADNASEVKA